VVRESEIVVSTHEWEPWSLEEVEALVGSEILELTSEARASLSTVRVRPEVIIAADGPGSDGQSYWVIARLGDRVVYWDSIEEEFGTGNVVTQRLRNYGTFGEKLELSLKRLFGDREGRTWG
jgi:hypothetical protein